MTERESERERENEADVDTADGPGASERAREDGRGSGESRGHTTSPQVAARLNCELNNDLDMWFAHVLVGDGVSTNEAAARRLLARARVEPLGPLRYFVAVHTCSSHQANLLAKTAVAGVAAKVTAVTGAESE